ncbi:hypothetical protein Y032_0258g425 [Ancylostoma ceylanicum]|uniref:Uncharacterized protein n=1 Tax=Ancylostoma ceylanicum TaxID=53326 RepID=A0A016SAP7_9BILA|nr:hypothetical protein Y032_0258g425 [Ancylostoma ceylanicum]
MQIQKSRYNRYFRLFKSNFATVFCYGFIKLLFLNGDVLLGLTLNYESAFILETQRNNIFGLFYSNTAHACIILVSQPQ